MKEYSETLDTNADGATYAVRSTGHDGNEPVAFVVAGTWDSGTVVVKMACDTASPVYAAVPSASWTDDVGDKLEMPQGTLFKFNLSGGLGSQDLTLDLKGHIQKVS